MTVARALAGLRHDDDRGVRTFEHGLNCVADEGPTIDVAELSTEHHEVRILGLGSLDKCFTGRAAFPNKLTRFEARLVRSLDRTGHHRRRSGVGRVVGGASAGEDAGQLVDPIDDV